jgi:hypothetical protein
MYQFSRTALAGVVVLGAFTFVAGCQNSGSADRTSTSSRDTGMRAEVTVGTGRFDQPYEATRETQWVSSKAADADKGMLAPGDRVMFDRAPGTDDWQEARTTSDRTVYVHPSDFRRVP